MGVIYLVRHGQASRHAYGARGTDRAVGGLTDLGRAQARLTGAMLAGRITTIDSVVTGTLARQQETLDLILEAFPQHPSPVTDARWNEYDLDAILGGTGIAAATTGHDPDLQRLVDAGLAGWVEGSTAGRETFDDYFVRCLAALTDIRVGSGQTALVVTSAGTIMSVVAQLWEVPPAGWITMTRTVSNASVSKLIVGQRGISGVSLNEHAHLETAEPVDGESLLTFR